MKLLTHNFLTSKAMRGVQSGYPLKLVVEEKKEVETDFVPEFIQRTIPRLDWPTVVGVAQIVGVNLPAEINDALCKDQDFLKQVHHVLLEIDIVNGHMECPETGRKFPIQNGIPNMVLNELEV